MFVCLLACLFTVPEFYVVTIKPRERETETETERQRQRETERERERETARLERAAFPSLV